MFLLIPTYADSMSHLIPRGHIVISGDAGFTAANGVTGGSGTSSDPFVISGWDILVPNGEDGIFIQSVSSYFVIENNRVRAQGFPAQFNNGIWLYGAGANGTVRDNVLTQNARGILVLDSDVLIEGNLIASNYIEGDIVGGGVWASGIIRNLTLRHNVIADNYPYGVYRGYNVLLPARFWSIVDARENYWGGPLAPAVSVNVDDRILIPAGPPGGNYVTPTVSFVPWLLVPP